MSINPYDPYTDIQHAQQLAEQGVRGYGHAAEPQLRRSIGNALGGLNAMGALRSGGTVQALHDISQDYGNQIGAFADQASLNAMQTGLGANQARLNWQEAQFAQDQARRAQHAGVLRTIGGVLGAGIGFLSGGASGALGSVASPGYYDPNGTSYSAGDPSFQFGGYR